MNIPLINTHSTKIFKDLKPSSDVPARSKAIGIDIPSSHKGVKCFTSEYIIIPGHTIIIT